MVNKWKSIIPHESEADLEGRRVVLIIDDNGEEERSNEVGQGDNDWGQILDDQIPKGIALQNSKSNIWEFSFCLNLIKLSPKTKSRHLGAKSFWKMLIVWIKFV